MNSRLVALVALFALAASFGCNPPCGPGDCCSEWGFCGNTAEHCRGGGGGNNGGGNNNKCNPPCGAGECCSQWGYCGNTAEHCGGGGGNGPTPPPPPPPPPANNGGGGGNCNPPCGAGECCSQWGYCGTTAEHCGGGGGNGPQPPPPPPNNGNGGGGAITADQLRRVMQNSLPYEYINDVNDVMNQYGLNTPLRRAGFLAQVRHETAGLTTFFQPLDNGAGAIHMLPANFRIACEDVPEIKAAFGRIGGCRGGSDVEAGMIIRNPRLAFLTGTWWMTQGAQKILGGPCGDLRRNLDEGMGTQNPLTGYYMVSRCIFGGNPDAGLAQRISYYNLARQVFGA